MAVEDLPDYHLPRVVLIDHVKLIDLISEITLIKTINSILQIDNIASVDLIDEISLIDTITTISEIAHITLIDAITQINGINPTVGGEQVENGDFETGDTTGWTGTAQVTDQYSHGGTYSAIMYSQYLEQHFATPIPKSLISSFGFWHYRGPVSSSNDYFRIYYSDGTYTEEACLYVDEWTYHDLLALIPDGKCVSYIYIRGGTGSPYWIDDISLVSISANSIIDLVKEVVKIDSMPDLTIETLPDVIIRDATESTQKLAVDANGKITVNIPEVTQSDETLLKATVTQAAKDRTVTGTVTAEQTDQTKLKATVTQAAKDRTVTGTVTAEQTTAASLKGTVYQSDETLLKTTVTQAAKDRTISSVDATATAYQISLTANNGNSAAIVTPAGGKALRLKFISLEQSAAVDIGYRFGAAGTIYYLRTTAGVYVSNLIGCNNQGAVDAALFINSSGATNVKGYILVTEV